MRSVWASVPLLLFLASPAAAQDVHSLSGGYRFGGLPDFVVDAYFEDHQPVFAHGAAFEYSFGDEEGYWSAGITYVALATPAGYWRSPDSLVEEASWLDFSLSFLGVYAGRTWRLELTDGLFLSPSIGLGLMGILGNAYSTQVVPGCTGQVTDCGHWNEVTRNAVEITYRVMPLIIATGSLQYELTHSMSVSLDVGFLNLPFVGMSFRHALDF